MFSAAHHPNTPPSIGQVHELVGHEKPTLTHRPLCWMLLRDRHPSPPHPSPPHPIPPYTTPYPTSTPRPPPTSRPIPPHPTPPPLPPPVQLVAAWTTYNLPEVFHLGPRKSGSTALWQCIDVTRVFNMYPVCAARGPAASRRALRHLRRRVGYWRGGSKGGEPRQQSSNTPRWGGKPT